MAMERQRESEIKECVARIREKSSKTNSVSDQVFRIRHTSLQRLSRKHDSESRLLRHRAVALQDMAHSILEHELSEDFEQVCPVLDRNKSHNTNTKDVRQAWPLKS